MGHSAAADAVLVTRPAGQAEALRAAIAAAGFTVHCQPLLELQPLVELSPQQRGRILDLDHYQHLVFVSGNAVHYGMERIEDYWPQLPCALNWYAVGESTAARLSEYGVRANSPNSDMSSEGLLALPQLQAVAGQRVLIVKGEGGRNTLRQELERRGARVDELACYRRSRPDLPPGELARLLEHWRIGVVLISSGEGFDNMRALLSPAETSKFTGIGLIVPSGRVAGLARDAGFTRIMTADNASDAAMLRALEMWRARETNH